MPQAQGRERLKKLVIEPLSNFDLEESGGLISTSVVCSCAMVCPLL
jgi:hypothetical protein